MISEGQLPHAGKSRQLDCDALQELSFEDVGLQSAGKSATLLLDYSLNPAPAGDSPACESTEDFVPDLAENATGQRNNSPQEQHSTRMDMGQDPDPRQAGG